MRRNVTLYIDYRIMIRLYLYVSGEFRLIHLLKASMAEANSCPTGGATRWESVVSSHDDPAAGARTNLKNAYWKDLCYHYTAYKQ